MSSPQKPVATTANPDEAHAKARMLAETGEVQHTAEAAVRELKGIMDNASMGIAVTRDRKFFRYNASFAKMFGFEGDTGIGQPGRAIYVSDEDYAEVGRLAGQTLAKNLPLEHDLFLRRGDGSSFWGNLKAFVVDPNDPTAGTIWITEDRSALKAAEVEIRDALQQQTALSESLKAISNSPADVQPVLDTIVRNAVVLCEALFGAVFRFDGELMHMVAHHNMTPEVLGLLNRLYPMRPSREQATGRVILDGTLVHIHDALADTEYRQEVASRGGWRSVLAVPMSRDGAAIGVIWVARAVAGPFPSNEIALLNTFADQAVIAVEKVRMFRELEARTEALARSVDEMRVLGEVGQAVSSSLDLDTVLLTIITHAVELSKADAGGTIYEFDEEEGVFVPRASHGMSEAMVAGLRNSRIRIGETSLGMCAKQRAPYQIGDVMLTPEGAVRDLLLRENVRAVLAVPLLREERVIGGLVIRRTTAGEFPGSVVMLLQNLAGQSLLAIQNARLFRDRLGRMKGFFSPQIAELIVSGGGEDLMKTHRREVVVIFTDLRGFTAFTDSAEPEEVMAVLGDFHRLMGPLIISSEGTLVHFAGDGLMVLFNDPITLEDPLGNAVNLAIRMQEVFASLRGSWKKRGYELDLGIGIAQGYATLGTIGFEGRWEYTCIGSVANLASRLCGEAKGGQILVNQKTLGRIEDRVEALPLGEVTLKGIAHPVQTFKITALKS